MTIPEYISVRQAAEKWQLSPRQVQWLCKSEMIPGLIRFGRSWAIPQTAPKPTGPAQEKLRPKSQKALAGLADQGALDNVPEIVVSNSFDSKVIEHKKADYSFTLFETTYRQRTGELFKPEDYLSFGLVNQEGFLTQAGSLMADQRLSYNSRLFCTRWNGLVKGSVFDDALDDKEYEGGLIYLLNNGQDFVKNNTKVRFKKEARSRVDKPDYAERAVTEALVNALIHRDYWFMGCEIHIDIFDNRLAITSPGGRPGPQGPLKAIPGPDLEFLSPWPRNPVIAKLFQKMKYAQGQGTGLPKIIEETKKLPDYHQGYLPEFLVTESSFMVVLKNLNYEKKAKGRPGAKSQGPVR
jgi:ATP-dependent DNA helicase RecG